MTNEEAMAKQWLVIRNIFYLLKKQKKKIGDMENSVGVTKGYFSRCGYGSKSPISFPTMLVAADYVNMSLQELSSRDIEKENELEDLEEQISKLERKRAELLEERKSEGEKG